MDMFDSSDDSLLSSVTDAMIEEIFKNKERDAVHVVDLQQQVPTNVEEHDREDHHANDEERTDRQTNTMTAVVMRNAVAPTHQTAAANNGGMDDATNTNADGDDDDERNDDALNDDSRRFVVQQHGIPVKFQVIKKKLSDGSDGGTAGVSSVHVVMCPSSRSLATMAFYNKGVLYSYFAALARSTADIPDGAPLSGTYHLLALSQMMAPFGIFTRPTMRFLLYRPYYQSKPPRAQPG